MVDKYAALVPEDIEAMFFPCKNYIQYEPLGVVGVYGTWNVPLCTTIKPLI